MKTINTQVDIDASLDEVWRVLTDLPGYTQWNPFIRRVDGHCRANEIVTIHMEIAGKGRQAYRVKLTAVDSNRRFRWLGHFHIRGLIDGDHTFDLAVLADGRVRVRQYEYFTGLLVPLVWRGFILRHLLPSFEQLNANLKAWCERRPLPVTIPTAD